MDTRFLTHLEFQSVYFYKLITLAILVGVCILFLLGLADMKRGELALIAPVLALMCARFAVECVRLRKCGAAFIHNDELVISHGASHRQIPLTSISAVSSKHSLFMVRRYRSWSDHLAFVQLTLNSGERVSTLAESAVFEFPAGKTTLAALEAAVLSAKVKSAASAQ